MLTCPHVATPDRRGVLGDGELLRLVQARETLQLQSYGPVLRQGRRVAQQKIPVSTAST